MADFIAENITKEFATPTGPLRILDGLSLELNRGESLAVVGPSGCGKSTFLHIAGTLDTPTSGRVNLLGTDLNQITPAELPAFRNQHIGFIFQEHHLLPQLTAIENILIPVLANPHVSKDQRKEMVTRAEWLLQQVGLQDRIRHRPRELSGGERQRVAVARALILNPELILADEPTGSLDPANADKIGEVLIELQANQNVILICVTHSLKLAADFQKKVRLENGKLVDE